jgi:hypothetical protein
VQVFGLAKFFGEDEFVHAISSCKNKERFLPILSPKPLTMYKLFIASALLIASLTLRSQPPITQPEIDPFIPTGYETLDYVAGDLNGDKKKDGLLILKASGEDSVMEEELPRPLIVLIRQADGKLKQVLRNDKAIMCRRCGGVFGDPYEGVQVFDKGFSLSFYGGSNWRWGYTYEFVYRPLKKNWYLVKESQSSFHSGDPETTMKSTEINETELGEIPLDKFNSSPVYEDSKWKVKAVKTFFYDSPKLGSKPRKGYLMKGNIASGIRLFKNFIEVSFENSKGTFTSGYILRKDLQKLDIK